MTKHPTAEWEWDDYAEEEFVEWFHGDYGPFTLRSEYFFGDCEVEDVKTRQDLMYRWVHSAFLEGYNMGRLSEAKVGLTDNE